MPSPHVVNVHKLHVSVLTEFPSSHCSAPDQTILSPHIAVLHAFVHESVLFVLPSSHVSPAAACITPSPHISIAIHALNPVHNALHDCAPTYPLIVQDCEFESHCSTPALMYVSPHTAVLHVFKQASVLITFPSSHCSPASVTEFPHTEAVAPVQTLL